MTGREYKIYMSPSDFQLIEREAETFHSSPRTAAVHADME